MNGRVFTLAEANRALPLVRVITRDAVQRYAAAKQEIRAWEELRGDVGRDGAALAEHDRKIAHELEHLRRLTEELEALGCRLRDFEKGAVDVPAACLGPGHFVYYSWAIGDKSVSHWRGEEEPFEHRHLVVVGP